MKLQPPSEHPHGLSDTDFDVLFTTDKPVIFAYHGYPPLIHRLTYRRTNHRNLHVRGYKEEGTTTTPFDMVVLNELDRFHLPPRPDSTWSEWHYFNLVTAQDEWWYMTYLVGGEVPDP
mgnify:CR=1 FL=1